MLPIAVRRDLAAHEDVLDEAPGGGHHLHHPPSPDRRLHVPVEARLHPGDRADEARAHAVVARPVPEHPARPSSRLAPPCALVGIAVARFRAAPFRRGAPWSPGRRARPRPGPPSLEAAHGDLGVPAVVARRSRLGETPCRASRNWSTETSQPIMPRRSVAGRTADAEPARFARVRGPVTPSTSRPRRRWNGRTARSSAARGCRRSALGRARVPATRPAPPRCAARAPPGAGAAATRATRTDANATYLPVRMPGVLGPSCPFSCLGAGPTVSKQKGVSGPYPLGLGRPAHPGDAAKAASRRHTTCGRIARRPAEDSDPPRPRKSAAVRKPRGAGTE